MKNINDLTQKKCQPCEGMGKPLSAQEAREYLNTMTDWQLHENGTMIYREFLMKNFMAAIDMVNRIAKIAESENHHPDIHLRGYRKLRVELSTHAIGGLSENDFIEAAKINELPADLKQAA